MFAQGVLTMSRCVRFLVMAAVVVGSGAVAQAGPYWTLDDTESVNVVGGWGQFPNATFTIDIYTTRYTGNGMVTTCSTNHYYQQYGMDTLSGYGLYRTYKFHNDLFGAIGDVSEIYGQIWVHPSDGGPPFPYGHVDGVFHAN